MKIFFISRYMVNFSEIFLLYYSLNITVTIIFFLINIWINREQKYAKCFLVMIVPHEPPWEQRRRYILERHHIETVRTDTFHEPTTFKLDVWASSEEIKTFARHKYGREGVLRVKMRSLVMKLQSFEKCQFSNCSHLFASGHVIIM